MGPASRTGYVRVNGVELYYEIHGQGAPLVLLYGRQPVGNVRRAVA